MAKQLTPKQLRFVDVYDGNIKAAAKASQLSYAYCRQLITLTKHSHVQAAIQSREATKSNNRIADRQKRQEFWSDTMNEDAEDMKHRLKASELLGRSEADFTDKVKHQGDPDAPLEVKTKMDTSGLEKAMEGEE